MNSIVKKFIYIIVLVVCILLIINYFSGKEEVSNKNVVNKQPFCNYDIIKYIKNDSLLRVGRGFKGINLNNYFKDTVSKHKITEFIFNLKSEKQDGLLKFSYDCTKNIFLDYFYLKNGDEFRVQSSFSDNSKLSHRYVILTNAHSGYKKFLTNIEQIELLQKNLYLLINDKYFYGLEFKKDTVIDFNGEKYIKVNNVFKKLEKEPDPYHRFDEIIEKEYGTD